MVWIVYGKIWLSCFRRTTKHVHIYTSWTNLNFQQDKVGSRGTEKPTGNVLKKIYKRKREKREENRSQQRASLATVLLVSVSRSKDTGSEDQPTDGRNLMPAVNHRGSGMLSHTRVTRYDRKNMTGLGGCQMVS